MTGLIKDSVHIAQ